MNQRPAIPKEKGKMRGDLHVHSIHSPDGREKVEDIIRYAKEVGLDIISITDHNTMKAYDDGADDAAEKYGIILIHGIEISTKQGHVLAYGLREMPPIRKSVRETVEAVHRLGGIAVAAHPFRLISGVGTIVVRREDFDGIEVRNARSTFADNHLAHILATSQKKGFTAGSDAHALENIGLARTVFPESHDTSELLTFIKERKTDVEGKSRGIKDTFVYASRSFRNWSARGFHRI